MTWNRVFPFAAVAGQQPAKQALLIAAVNPRAGGVVLAGEKGTAKSTLVRGLAGLLRTAAMVELPLNATEDMVFGSLDMQAALRQGRREAVPGLLAEANDGILYIDELNLLRREIVNGIVDVAATGINTVEREGISCRFPAQFIMIGSMNPEEGSLQPQLLDRFGMYVPVTGERDPAQRMEIVRRILAYEQNQEEFYHKYSRETEQLKQKLVCARRLLPRVELSESMLSLAARLCWQAACAGHRAELFLVEAARAIAALAGRQHVLPDDVTAAARLVLPHRQQDEAGQSPPSRPDGPSEQPAAAGVEEQSGNSRPPGQDGASEKPSAAGFEQPVEDASRAEGSGNEQVMGIGAMPSIGKLTVAAVDRKARQGSGKRSLTRTNEKMGRYVRAVPGRDITDLAVDATLRAAAPRQCFRVPGCCAIRVCREDWHTKIREKRIGTTFLFVVDASGSMGAQQRMKAVKGTVLAMLRDAYQQRDKVGLIAFRRDSAELLLPVTRSVDLAQKCLAHLPTGGRTPLAEGLMLAHEVLQSLRRREEGLQAVVVLVTDGRANSGGGQPGAVSAALAAARHLGGSGARSLVIDTEQQFVKLGIAGKIARILGGAYFPLEELSAQSIIRIVGHLR